MAKKLEPVSREVVIEELRTEAASFWVVGTTPLIYHAMPLKAMRELLMPKGRKTAAEKAQSLKHDPYTEFADSTYRTLDDKGPTRLLIPSTCFKAAVCHAALEVPGATKAQVGRLIWVEGDYIPLYGIPKLFMQVVRSSDFNKTPDVRTRAIMPEWACNVRIRFVRPTMTAITVARLLAAAGLIMGIGDFRQQKGQGNFGQFVVVDEADAKKIIATGGLKAQDAALKKPVCYDRQTEELLAWFDKERVARGK